MKMIQVLQDNVQAIVKVMVEKALDGDTAAAGLCLARVVPTLKAQSERVQFEFDANAPLAEQVAAVLQAIANGEVSTDVGKQIIEAIGGLAAIKQIDELEIRLTALEGRGR
ncbi:MAG: hypothetical protein P8Y63_01180 [Deltaproteobacteria bacterium]|jgi:Asp-tRNA(Asn)/Glu-tRNA(Gln) amidotransferase B subunit